MEIVQATFGTFHSFDLARELHARGHLKRIYSTFPWQRVKREGVPRERVRTFPFVHVPEYLLASRGLLPGMRDTIRDWNGRTFDAWLARVTPSCDAMVALSGVGVQVGPAVQRRGAKFITDRGSTHRAWQEKVLMEEYRRWGLPYQVDEAREMERELAVYALADAITVPSQQARASFAAQGVPVEKVFVLPYGVRLERFSKVADPPVDRFEVLFVGGVTLRKGIPYLLQAFAALRHPHKRLRVVGRVSEEIQGLLPRLPTESVEFLGALPQAELPAVMSASHVMVLPSVEEGLALVQGQSMACGCPVIATEATGGRDLFDDGVEGFLLPDTSVGPLADRMQQMADDAALRERMSEAALLRVRKLGGWHQYGDRWTALLQQLTGKQ